VRYRQAVTAVSACFLLLVGIGSAAAQDADPGIFEGNPTGSGSYAYDVIAQGEGNTVSFDVEVSADGQNRITVLDESPTGDLSLDVSVLDENDVPVPVQLERTSANDVSLVLSGVMPGTYRIVVGEPSGQGGRVGILVRQRASAQAVTLPSKALKLGSGLATEAGTLSAGQEALYSFEGKKGQAVVFTLDADGGDSFEFDTILRLYAGDTAAGELLTVNDDSRGGLGSQIIYRLPADGPYTVRAADVFGSPGGFRLEYGLLDVRIPEPLPLAVNVPGTDARLDESAAIDIDSSLDGFRRYGFFKMPSEVAPAGLIAAGEKVRIVMTSADIDPFLELGFDTPFGFSVIASNDDAIGTDAMLEIDPATLPERFGPELLATWWQLLRVRALSAFGGEGSYTISLSTVPSADVIANKGFE
jgi:hypothetical protein